MIKISIIIATYNVEKTIVRCIDSIVTQKNEQIELIIIDGKSTDNTVAILSEYKENIDFFISEKDSGIYDAWNKGIMRARGKWIMFLGADDVLRGNAINQYLEYTVFFNDEVDIILAKLNVVNKNGKILRYVGEPWNWDRFKVGNFSFAHPGLLHSRHLFTDYGLFDTSFKICGDSDFFLRVGKYIKAGFMDVITVDMYEGGCSDSYKAIIESFQVRKKNQSIPFRINLKRFIRKFLVYTASKTKRSIKKYLTHQN